MSSAWRRLEARKLATVESGLEAANSRLTGEVGSRIFT